MPAQRKSLAQAVNPVAALVVELPNEDEARRLIFDRIKEAGENLAGRAQAVANHAQNSWQHYGPPDTHVLMQDIEAFDVAARKLHRFMLDFHIAAVERNKNPPDDNPDVHGRAPRMPVRRAIDVIDEPPF